MHVSNEPLRPFFVLGGDRSGPFPASELLGIERIQEAWHKRRHLGVESLGTESQNGNSGLCGGLISKLLFALLLVGVASAADPHLISSADYADPRQYTYLTPLLEGVEVVSLAESIHLTHEFPLIRIGMVRYMNEHVRFGVLAFEGSPVDVWATQDQFLASSQQHETAPQEAALSQANSGLLGVWNTPEMRPIFQYEQASWRTSHPLYVTAYDIQPGLGRGTREAAAFQLLRQRLQLYAAPPRGFDEDKWMHAIGLLASSCFDYRPSDRTEVVSAIDALEKWIGAAAPEVEKKYPDLPHAAVLRLPRACAPRFRCVRQLGPGSATGEYIKPPAIS